MCGVLGSYSLLPFVAYFSIALVAGYENAYDLLERRNQRRFQEPYLRSYQPSETFMNYDDRGHYYNHNPDPFVHTTSGPFFSKFGNGYDNLGNGIPPARSHSFRQEPRYRDSWGFSRAQFPSGNFEDRLPVKEQPFVSSYRHKHYPIYYSRRHYPKYEEKFETFSNIYGDKFGSGRNLGSSNVNRFLEDNEDKKQKKTDEVFQRNYEGINMDYAKKEKTGEQSHSDQSEENKSSLRSNKVVKKGHVTKGFASHHHKDETGNSTTFFDESSDFGGQTDFKDVADGFGTRKTLEHTANREDEKVFKENGGQANNYGSGLSIGNQRFEKDFTSEGHHVEDELKFIRGRGNEDAGLTKTFQYLNGDRFDFSQPHSHDHYY